MLLGFSLLKTNNVWFELFQKRVEKTLPVYCSYSVYVPRNDSHAHILPVSWAMLNSEDMKYLLLLLVLVVLGGGAYWHASQPAPESTPSNKGSYSHAPADASVVGSGEYVVVAQDSRVEWAGKKPLIEGYINTGSIAVTEGSIAVSESNASGSFSVDMNTISVSATPAKPGQENALETHLKGERWFDVARYPSAVFEIESVTPRPDSYETFLYDVTGNLTLKGSAHRVEFPATIYQSSDGRLHAHGNLEVDRTKWGVTAGSASFFDNLADNAVDDMVALSFALIAEKQ